MWHDHPACAWQVLQQLTAILWYQLEGSLPADTAETQQEHQTSEVACYRGMTFGYCHGSDNLVWRPQ